VTLIDVSPAPMASSLGLEMGRRIAGLVESNGVSLLCGSSVERVELAEREAGASLWLSSGQSLQADVIVSAAGASAATGWLDGSGFEVADGVVCDAYSKAAKGVYACGDVARWMHPEFGSMRAQHWSNAAEQGIAAATNLYLELQGLEHERRPYEPVPYFWSDHFGCRLQAVGHPQVADETVAVKEDENGTLLLVYLLEGRPVAAAGYRCARAIARCKALIPRASNLRALLEGLDMDLPSSAGLSHRHARLS